MDETDIVKLIIFYQNRKTCNLVMKNNLSDNTSDMNRTGVVYQYTCPIGDCKLRKISYVGMTTTTLSRRLTSHLQTGSPKTHTLQEHGITLTREMLVNNTDIIDASSDKRRLQIKEALHILQIKPTMNVQIGSTSIPLPSFNRLSQEL